MEGNNKDSKIASGRMMVTKVKLNYVLINLILPIRSCQTVLPLKMPNLFLWTLVGPLRESIPLFSWLGLTEWCNILSREMGSLPATNHAHYEQFYCNFIQKLYCIFSHWTSYKQIGHKLYHSSHFIFICLSFLLAKILG